MIQLKEIEALTCRSARARVMVTAIRQSGTEVAVYHTGSDYSASMSIIDTDSFAPVESAPIRELQRDGGGFLALDSGDMLIIYPDTEDSERVLLITMAHAVRVHVYAGGSIDNTEALYMVLEEI